MEKNSAGSPLDQTIEQYKRDLMAVYRRSRTPVSPADQPPAPKPARPRPADPPAAKSALAEMPPEPSHAPEPAHEEPTGELPEETAPEKAQLPTLGEFLRERIGNPPDNSGTPRDAIGRNEEEYLTAAAAFLRELLAQFAPGSKLSGESAEPDPDSTGAVPEEPERPTLGEFLRERIGNPPDNSGTPRDAIGRNEEEYLTAAAAFLRELLAQFAPGSKLSGESTEPGSDSPDAVPEEPERPTLGEFLRERIGNPPDNSGTPRDAIGRNEEEYLTAAAAFLRELLARYAEKTSSADNTHHTTNGQNFQPPAATKGEYEQFQQENPDSGVIKTQVFTARRTYPVENAQVNLYKVFPDGAYLIDSQFTDRSGQVKPVTVPALERSLSEPPGDPTPYVSYRITVSHPDFMDAVIEQVPVFEGVTSLQAVDLIPAAAAPVDSPDEP